MAWDAELRAQVNELYRAVWPWLPEGIERAARFGSDWYAVSTPNVVWREGRVVAHAGVVDAHLWLEGERRVVSAVHAVCVHPEWRGRGLGRVVMQQALETARARGHVSCILWSEKVDFYRRFGFTPVLEPELVGCAPAPRGAPGVPADLSDEAQLRRLRSLLAQREPVSRLAAAGDDGWHFLIDLALWREGLGFLRWIDDDAAALAAVVDGALHVYDVVARRLPGLDRLTGAWEIAEGTPVVLHFTPDVIAPSFAPRAPAEPDRLHVLGEPLVRGTAPWALSPLTRT